jgi:RNA polymerase sigma factor for flagellar operon FliA
LRSFGRDGLLDAARSYNEQQGVPFERWATLRIRAAMIDGVRRWGAIPRRTRRRLQGLETADSGRGASRENREEEDQVPSESSGAPRSLLVSLDDMTVALVTSGPGGLGATPEDAVAQAELGSLVRAIVGRLPHRERVLVEQTYFQGLTISQAAASMGVTRSWATRVHARALEKLQRELRKRDGTRSVGGKTWPLKK